MTDDSDRAPETPLAVTLKERILAHGPMPVRQYMQSCLRDRDHGYYVHRDAIGRAGDFVTAPEISQVFGELIGLWCVVVWQQMGQPSPFNLIEFGPGRGTMLRDALRAARIAPGFLAAARVLLIEGSPRLRAIQVATLADTPVAISHMAEPHVVDDTPKGPAILLANEFLDCGPIEQLERALNPAGGEAWCERTVALDDRGGFRFGRGKRVEIATALTEALAMPEPHIGDILEGRPVRGFIEGITHATQGHWVAALFIDYGHMATGFGDTLQAVNGHETVGVFHRPGESDLSAQVDFNAFAHDARRYSNAASPLAVDGPITQAEFLGRLGIIERAHSLMAANPAIAAEIEAGVARLMAVPGMGDRFKVIGLRRPDMPPLPGF